MNYKLEDLIDIELLQSLQEKLNVIYSFPSAIIDNDGKVLTAVAWQDICTKFHRTHPECEKECIKSDQYILEHLHEANPAVSYQCPHGMIDNAMPIIIDGKHLGNFFTGQFFLEKPDLEFFKKQAKKYGFDEKAYIEAAMLPPTLFDPGNSDPPIPVRCHIIDLSPYVDIFLAQYPNFCPNLVCKKAYWESGTFPVPPLPLPTNNLSILKDNTFDGDGNLPPCFSFPPHDNYR
jgi:ligand-binding sensor protein